MDVLDPHSYSKQELQKMLQVPDWNCPVEKTYRKSIKSPASAIRAMCVLCMGGSVGEITSCTKTNCPLWPFRLGKNPFDPRAGITKDTSHLRK